MTVLDRAAAPTQPSAPQSRPVWPARVVAACVALVALAFLQDPGRVAADTKLDLTVNPWGLLSRSLHLWDPIGFFGQLQNQAYGYLWPMGPFFGLGQTLHVPVWVIQRLWWSVILLAAFLGMYALLRAMRVGNGWPQILAGLAYALAVRPQSALGAISVEVLPMAVAPWVLVPLVRASTRGNVARAAALSALAVTMAGGVNAVAAGAVLPLALWWLLTLQPGRRRRQLMGWWFAMVSLAILWWLIPLVLLGKYSPPFLDWIESASFTTSITDPVSVLRGADHWLAYLGSATAWRAGWILATYPLFVVATGVIAAAGVAGLTMRSLPNRTFLVGSALGGLVLVTLGHTGVLSGLGSEQIQTFLDGAGAPIRNVHKFDLVLRIPLIIAFCHVLSSVWPSGPKPRWRIALSATLVGCLLLSWWPAASGQLASGRTYEAVPEYWQEASDWLVDNGGQGRALIVPGASSGTYLWGRAQDEPLQAFGAYPWGVRDAVPLSSAGNIRNLDAVEARLEAGYASPGLAEFFDRMGVRYLVVRNDLAVPGAPAPGRVGHAIDASAGLNRVASFGDEIRRSEGTSALADDGVRGGYPAVEIYSVTADDNAPDPRVLLRDLDSAVTVDGGPEALLPLADLGALGDRVVTVSGDEQAARITPGLGVLTDTDRRREITFGHMRDNESPTMTSDSEYEQKRPVHDYRVAGAEGTTIAEPGLEFDASSSASDVGAVRRLPRGATPAAAMDGALDTWWLPGDTQDTEAFWSVRYEEPVDVGQSIELALFSGDERSNQPVTLKVVTDTGSASSTVDANSSWQSVSVPGGSTTSVRLEITAGESDLIGIREIKLPGEGISVLRLPDGGQVDALLLTARPGDAGQCVTSGDALRCSDLFAAFSQDRPGLFRVVDLPTALTGAPRMLVAPRDGVSLTKAIRGATGLDVESSSARTSSPAGSALAAFDRDPGTAWQASSTDKDPTVRLRLPEPERLRGIRIMNEKGLNASAPLQIAVTVGDQRYSGFTDESGAFRFPSTRTDRISVEVLTKNPVRTASETGMAALPVGISELGLIGADSVRQPLPKDARVSLPCGTGPSFEVDGQVVDTTSVAGRIEQIMAGDLLPAHSCRAQVRIPAGEHKVSVRSSEAFQPIVAGVIPAAVEPRPSRPESPVVQTWSPGVRTMQMASQNRPRVLEISENYNPGWRATVDATELTGVRVDGWKQAFVVPAGVGGEVTVTFGPDAPYRWGLLAGLLAVLIVLIVAIRPPRADPEGSAVSRHLPRVIVGAVAVTVVLVLGPWGLLAFAAGLALARMVRPEALAFAGVTLAVLVCAVAGVRPGPVAAAVQGCAIAAALAALALSFWAERSVARESPGSGSAAEPVAR